jgi:transcriptional regulator with XRE-family HTH domain
VKKIMQHDFAGSSPVADHYHVKSLGAPFKVYLADGFEVKIDQISKKENPAIKDLPGLIAAVVRARVLHDKKLSGDDLKFIRSALRVKAKDIAEATDMTPENYSRCESGLRIMSITTEKVYRAHVYLMSFLNDKSVQDKVDKRPPGEGKDASAEKAEKAKAEKAYAAFRKIFMEMKINPVCDAGEDLALLFWRGERLDQDAPRGDDEPEWKNELPERKVA